MAEESLQVVSHPRLAIGQGREDQRGVIAQQTHFVESERLVADHNHFFSRNTLGPMRVFKPLANRITNARLR